MPDQDAFDHWCVVELLGHRRVAGRVREVQIAGAGMLRLDIPATPGHGEQTQYISPGAVYALHPTTRDVATAVAEHHRPEPVARWELPTSPPAGPSPLERDLLRLLDRVEHVTCEHGHQDAPDPACAGCVVRTLATLAGRHGIDDDTDPYSLDAARNEGYEPDPDPDYEPDPDPDYGKDLDDEDDEDPRAWQG